MEKNVFDKKRCMSAIYAIAKEKGIKIGDLEKEAGVSTGYLSKLNKEDNTSLPSIELLASVAKALGVTIDMLVYSDYEELSANEKYVLKFLDRLVDDTVSGELQWEKETKRRLMNVGCESMGNDVYATHPLYEAVEIPDAGDKGFPTGSYYKAYYSSRFYSDGDTLIAGDGFHAVLSPSDAEIYIMKVANEEANMGIGYDQFEVYLIKRGDVKPLCASDLVCGDISRQVQNLYKVIVDADSNLGVNDEVKSIIDLYMQEDEELPFN